MVTTFAWVDRYGTDYPFAVAKNVEDRSCALLLVFRTMREQHLLYNIQPQIISYGHNSNNNTTFAHQAIHRMLSDAWQVGPDACRSLLHALYP